MRAIKATIITILAVGLLVGSAVGVAAQDDARPTSFSWTLGDSEGETEGTFEESAEGFTLRDFAGDTSIVADDERASGQLTTAFNIDRWLPVDDEAFSVTTYSNGWSTMAVRGRAPAAR